MRDLSRRKAELAKRPLSVNINRVDGAAGLSRDPARHPADHDRRLGFELIAPYYDTPVVGTLFLGKPLGQ